MLCITRKTREAIRIGNTLVTVLEITGGRVKLGVAAPPEVEVRRPETEPPLRIHIEEMKAA